MAELRFRKLGKARQLQLGSEPVTIGRSSENAVVLSDRTVSRRHCVIEILSDAVRLRDLGSRYGTKVNGAEVDEARLYEGDRVGVGPYELVVTGIDTPPVTADRNVGPPGAAETIPIADEAGATRERDGNELAVDTDGQEGRVAELEQREAELAKQQEALRKDRAKLRRQRSKLNTQRAQLERDRHQLDADQAALEKKGLLGDGEHDDAAAAPETGGSADHDEARQLIEQQRAALTAEREQLAADRAALQEQQEAASGRESVVQQREDDLASREAHLDSRAADLEEQRKQLEALQAERDEQDRRDAEQREHLQSQLEDTRRQLDAATNSLAEKTDAVATLEAELGELRREHAETINSAETEQAELTERLATVESEAESLRQQANRAGGELEQKAAQLEEAMKQTLELQRRLEELTHAHGMSERRLDRIDSAMRRLHEPAELLGVAAKRLATAQQRVAELEAQWVRCDSTFNSAVQASQQQKAEQALAERDQIAAALEEANAARDQAAGELRAAAEDVVRLVRAVPTGADAGAQDRDRNGATRRKWFARKR